MTNFNTCKMCENSYEYKESNIFRTDLYCPECLTILFEVGELEVFVYYKVKGGSEK